MSWEQDLAELVRNAVRAELEPLRNLLERPTPPSDAVSMAEAALRLGVSKRTLARWLKEDDDNGAPPRVRTVHIGGRRLVPTSELERLLADGGPTDAAAGEPA